MRAEAHVNDELHQGMELHDHFDRPDDRRVEIRQLFRRDPIFAMLHAARVLDRIAVEESNPLRTG
jgi:hypothetical protein